jgi:hypothetical protein
MQRTAVRLACVGGAALALSAAVGCALIRSLSPGTVEVRVVDGDVPVAGATVGVRGTLALIGESYPVAATSPPDGRTAANGVVVFENVDGGEYRLSVGHDDFVFHVETVRVPGGERLVRVVALRRGVRVHGRLADPSDAPLGGVEVRVVAERPTAAGWTAYEDADARTTTAADGTFLTRAIEPRAALVLRIHLFRAGRAFVAQREVDAAQAGVAECGDFRVLGTETLLRLGDETPRDELRADGEVADAASGMVEPAFENVPFGADGVARVIGLPEGELSWRLIEVRLGPAPNEIVVGEGRAELAGARREVKLRRTLGTK